MGKKQPAADEAQASPAVATQTVSHAYPDPEYDRFRHHPPYSMRSAMRYTFALSLLLWWLPTFGPMIAGYVGGRRAGGPWRGVVSAIFPVAAILFLAWGAERGTLGPWLAGIANVPGAIGDGLSVVFPPLEPYVRFVSAYLAAFVGSLTATLSAGAGGYLVTIVFAYIGGILSDQARREAGTGRGTSVGITIAQPLLAAFRKPFATWEDDHPEQFEELRRIPVRAAPHAEAAAVPKPPKVQKVEGKGVVSESPEGERPAGEALGKPERRERSANEKEVATRRFVERALRQYEAAHRR